MAGFFVLHWNARSASASQADGGNAVAEVDVCYYGKSRYVWQLCASRSHIMGDTKLVMNERERLENMTPTVHLTQLGHWYWWLNMLLCHLWNE